MTNVEAIQIIITDAQQERATRASYRRVARALNYFTLLSEHEKLAILARLGYIDQRGKLYQFLEGEKLPIEMK
jgi:hypothetical protein